MRAVILIVLFLLSAVAVSAMDSGEAKQVWLDNKATSLEKQTIHNQAKLDFAADNSPENEALVISTGKDVLYAALDEVDAWLDWKRIEAEENTEVSQDIIDQIKADVEANKAKIVGLRADVDAVKNRFELGVTWLKMVGKYFELLADVARNSGNVWAFIGDKRADDIEKYEALLRAEAEGNAEAIAKLDSAKAELDIARRNIENAKATYQLVKIPGTPLIKFAEGNSYLRAAQGNLLLAHGYLNQAFLLLR